MLDSTKTDIALSFGKRLSQGVTVDNNNDVRLDDIDSVIPEDEMDDICISDHSEAMTTDEFNRRWSTFKYNQLVDVGDDVVFPEKIKIKPREAFSKSAGGRWSAIGSRYDYGVKAVENSDVSSSDAVVIEAKIDTGDSGVMTQSINIEGFGEVVIYEFNQRQRGWNSRFREITWWVDKRIVGESSWAGLDEKGAVLDGRVWSAKKYSFAIEINILREHVKKDWTGFRSSKVVGMVMDRVRDHIAKRLKVLLMKTGEVGEVEITQSDSETVRESSVISDKVVGGLMTVVRQHCPTLSASNLTQTFEILTKLERVSSGFELLDKLASCSLNDLENWNKLMDQAS